RTSRQVRPGRSLREKEHATNDYGNTCQPRDCKRQLHATTNGYAEAVDERKAKNHRDSNKLLHAEVPRELMPKYPECMLDPDSANGQKSREKSCKRQTESCDRACGLDRNYCPTVEESHPVSV